MKRKVLAFLLCISLLPFGSVYAAGTAEDPFISESYIKGTFIPAVENVIKALFDSITSDGEESSAPSTGMITENLPAGKDIVLSSGQSIIILSGYARVSKDKGSIVNATMGLEAESGILYKNHRYIVCEDSSATVHILKASTVYMSENAKIQDTPVQSPAPETPVTVTPYPYAPTPSPLPMPTPSPSSTPQAAKPAMPFTDIRPGNRYYKSVLCIYEKGLITGMTPTLYAPGNDLSFAEAIKLAACLHQLYNEGSVSLESGSIWYESYLDYCLEKGIVSRKPTEMGSHVTRREFVEIIYNAMPEKEYGAINIIPEGSLGDVDISSVWGEKVYVFYRAGILTGVTKDSVHAVHDFVPEDYISRAEAASLINRMLDEDARIPFVVS